MNDVEKKMKQQQQNQYKEKKGEIGETVIDKKPSNFKQSKIDTDEYVDYEDVEE